MFLVELDIKSVPTVRDTLTKSLRPSLASHTAIVNMTNVTEGRWILLLYMFMGIIITNLKIIPSRHSSDIRK